MNKIIFVIVFCLAVNIYSQTSRTGSSNVFLLPQGYGIKSLNSNGTSGIINDVSNISALNPAAISQLVSYSFGLSYQFQTAIDEAWIAGIGTRRINCFLPQSFGGVVKYEKFSLGLGMEQKYNGSQDLGPIPVTTAEYPDGTGEFITAQMERSILNFSLIGVYDFFNLISENSTFSIGAKYNLNRFHNYENLWNTHAEGSAFGSSWEIGTVYKFEYEKDKNCLLGISYSSALEMSDKMKYSSDNELISVSDSSRLRSYYVIAELFIIRVKTPDELRFDLGIEPTKDIMLLMSIADVFWKTSAENIRNQIDLSSSITYSFNPTTTGSLGFYYTDYGYTVNYFDINGNMYALFITTGISFNINIVKVGLSLADNHIYSGIFREQTIGKISLDLTL